MSEKRGLPRNVCFGSLADIGERYQGCPLYRQKRTWRVVGINVCYVPKADMVLLKSSAAG